MTLLSVADALGRLLASVSHPTPPETVALAQAAGRVLSRDVTALRTQPPFAASAMDGYAVRAGDVAPGRTLRVVGESAAGRRHAGAVASGEAVRIFTGAPVPDGADAILIQENVDRADGATIIARQGVTAGRFIRPAGLDFKTGDVLLRAGQALGPATLALVAAMGHARVEVRARPRVAILATGDELVQPGEPAGPDQIVASNSFALAALVQEAGGDALDLGIAADTMSSLALCIDRARQLEADVLVTLGGASVGDHDLVQAALRSAGMDLSFWRIAMRPGKPLMHGRLGATVVLGLPGNPVSSIVCGQVFLKPLIATLLGRPPDAQADIREARLGAGLAANDERADYLRATLRRTADGLIATAFDRQDSSMLATLARADALLLREPHAPAAAAGETCKVLLI
jgi:molybdopterin molybdotransferase